MDRRKKMLQCGDGLEKFLNENISFKEYRKLAKSGLDILEIDFPLTTDESSLKLIEFIELNGLKDHFTSGVNDTHTLQVSVIAGTDIIGISKFLRDQYNDHHKTDVTHFKVVVDAGPKTKQQAIDILDEYIFYDILNLYQARKRTILPNLTNLYSTSIFWNEFPGIVNNGLYNHYGKIGVQYQLSNKRTQLVRKKTFAPYPISGDDNSIHWMPMLSNIFFDFLENGGQDCFKFCKHCGKFTVVKRSDKKFCSDICRTASQHQ